MKKSTRDLLILIAFFIVGGVILTLLTIWVDGLSLKAAIIFKTVPYAVICILINGSAWLLFRKEQYPDDFK